MVQRGVDFGWIGGGGGGGGGGWRGGWCGFLFRVWGVEVSLLLS